MAGVEPAPSVRQFLFTWSCFAQSKRVHCHSYVTVSRANLKLFCYGCISAVDLENTYCGRTF